MDFVFTFDEHERSPRITVNQYVRRKQLELSSYVSQKCKIYLDTNFWIILRKIVTGELSDPLSKRYFELANLLSEENLCIFPISENTFLEVLKQSDPLTLDETVCLIDKLSQGICLISYNERLRLGILHFVYGKTEDHAYNPSQLVWTKLAYNMGYITPVNKNIEESLDRILQKSFFDQMWQVSLSDMIHVMRSNGGPINTLFPDNSSSLNNGKFSHIDENRSFEQMFLSELAGLLDFYKPLLLEVCCHMYQKKTGKSLTKEEIETMEDKSLIANMIYNLFRLKKITTELPSYRVTAGLYAAVRWDKKQKFQANDMHDFRHASAALPYCDYFFTEKRLSHLLTQKLLSYDKMYSCIVKSSLKDAVTILERK